MPDPPHERLAAGTVIRSQRPEDAATLVDVHLRSWRWAYTGLIADEYIDLLWSQRAERTERTRADIQRASEDERFWLAEHDGQVVAFAYTHASGDDDTGPDTAEVGALYLVPEVAGLGIGRALLAHAVDDLRQRHVRRATLWVLDTNTRARRFYEAAGWRPDGATKTEERPGATLREVRYEIAFAWSGAIRRMATGDEERVFEAGGLFDEPPLAEPTRRFLASDGHHLLIAYDLDRPAGFVTGVEVTHPDKGTEMFIYELAVAEAFQRRGIGAALVRALRDLAIDRGCYGMWVLTDAANAAAAATYRAAGATEISPTQLLGWEFTRRPAGAVADPPGQA